MPPENNIQANPVTGSVTPSAKQQSWGVVISIVIIVCMIVVGAFYSWGKRIAEENQGAAPLTNQ